MVLYLSVGLADLDSIPFVWPFHLSFACVLIVCMTSRFLLPFFVAIYVLALFFFCLSTAFVDRVLSIMPYHILYLLVISAMVFFTLC